MDFKHYIEVAQQASQQVFEALMQTATYIQLVIVLIVFVCSFFFAKTIRRNVPALTKIANQEEANQLRKISSKFGNLVFPIITVFILMFSIEIVQKLLGHSWLINTALVIAILLICNRVTHDFVRSDFIRFVFRYIGIPLLFLHLVNLLTPIINILESMKIGFGEIQISFYDVVRVVLLGSVLFWLGRISNVTGKELIRRQEKLDFRTKEVAAKLFEVTVFVLFSLLLLKVMGINLTALAVFGGALGVGLGFGLQAIASNFISGIIILLDRSISIGDYIELEDGRTGIVRESTLRSTTLETFDGKDIMVPNERFVTESFTNWTHKNQKQRYRVDFSVAYDTDIRKLVEIIKQTVAQHEQVISGEGVPFEEQPDCEIDGFGDSGVNMFVEFWMEGIDDGKNRVGGDLLLMIFEAMRENGFVIPFPQREVRVLQSDNQPN
ncbi:mechanosensitive ion channel domain-containing protein [Vibrio sp. CK2-1]|uniref:mechanosensitive ion channel family protein n=1 Tax=Vibrio sp. CK2-1 TaxID=2912249 RepID=UPI001EFFC6B9|nr:mechanosensitive ion channel domain-containing protein [Vibrio sp. CK2-1]MCF7353304.1 mechanosensitive ion channel [Vibrio sp. CK2-1]